ncbi:MAG: OmpA family protein [Pseudobdellovibrio sp.]
MKKILFALTLAALFAGCSGNKVKPEDANGGVVSETTASGTSEKVDASAMDFSVGGSDSGKIDGLQTLHFDYDKSTLTDGEQKKLEGNVAWMKKNSSVKMIIEGHCDQRGSNEYNLSLGERRANAVKQMLVKMGISADRITTTSFGEEKLIDTGDSEEAMAKNRRANFAPVKK